MLAKNKLEKIGREIFIMATILFFPSFLFPQSLDLPFPRTVYQSPNGMEGGAVDYFYSRYDLAIHGWREESAAALNDSIRALNPDIIIFGTSRQGVWAGTEPPGMFAYHPVYLSLTTGAQPGDSEILLTSQNDYPTPSKHKYALIGSDDWITYTDINENGFIGVPSTGDWAIDHVHPAGDSVKFPIRMGGFGMLYNITPLAPLVEGKETWRWFIDDRFRRQDFSIFDGIFYDAFRLNLW